jgi:hypothetical protein
LQKCVNIPLASGLSSKALYFFSYQFNGGWATRLPSERDNNYAESSRFFPEFLLIFEGKTYEFHMVLDLVLYNPIRSAWVCHEISKFSEIHIEGYWTLEHLTTQSFHQIVHQTYTYTKSYTMAASILLISFTTLSLSHVDEHVFFLSEKMLPAPACSHTWPRCDCPFIHTERKLLLYFYNLFK